MSAKAKVNIEKIKREMAERDKQAKADARKEKQLRNRRVKSEAAADKQRDKLTKSLEKSNKIQKATRQVLGVPRELEKTARASLKEEQDRVAFLEFKLERAPEEMKRGINNQLESARKSVESIKRDIENKDFSDWE